MKWKIKRFLSALLMVVTILGSLLQPASAYASALKSPKTTDKVTLRTGKKIYYPGGLGDYSTCFYTIDEKTAYCLEPVMDSPGHGQYEYEIVEGNTNLEKALYYGYGGPGDVTGTYMPQFKEELKYVFTHIAAGYFYCGIKGFYGCTMGQIEACGALEWINYLESLPEPPKAELSLSDTALVASYEGGQQVTETTVLNGDSQNYVTISLPEDVTFHNKDNGSAQTGGELRIFGGTSFYFSAPMTVTGSWNSGSLTGSVQTSGKAIIVHTGSDTQDIGIYYKTEESASVSFTVEWMELTRVEVTKVDSNTNTKLPGAVFGIYRDQTCTDLLGTMPATNSEGISELEFPMAQNTVYVKEITAPTGYRCNVAVYPITLAVNQTASVTIPDVEQLGNLTVYKEGEVLADASSSESGTTFRYENGRQKGAVFNLYAAKDIITPYGATVYKAGELVADNLVTGADGSVTIKNLHLGVYRVAEARAPINFYNKGEIKETTLTYAGQTAEAAFSDTTFLNERQKAEIHVTKKDRETGNGLAGGVFGLYASEDITNTHGRTVVPKGTLISITTTDREGNAAFSVDLPIGFGYEVKEIQAPEGYLRNTEDVYSFRFSYTNDQEAKVSFSHVFANERVNATIHLQKKDKETKTNIPQGDATLDNAVYGLYARKDIMHPDKKTGVLYKAGEQVGTLTTDKDGKAEITGLYLGEYFVKEVTPSIGYLVDETEHDLICSYEGDLVATVERDCSSLEQVKKQPFQIIKAADNGKTDADLLSGVGFTAWLVSSLEEKENGVYDFSSAEPVVIGENGATEIFTDERGYTCSIPLPFGTYIVKETNTPHNYMPVKDFLVHITEHKPDTPQVWRVLLDDEFEAKLKIVKQDDETKKPVLAENTEFKVYDLDNKKYVEQVTTYPTVVTHKSYFTDSQGYLILPQNLKIGHYRIEEVNAPFGYVLNENYYEVAVDSDTLYRIDDVSGDAIIDVAYENHPVKGELQIVKKGETLDRFDGKDFTYAIENLAGAEFNVYAAEDIFTADFQRDENGNRVLEYASGTLVETLVTDEDGKALVKNLPLGTYQVEETKAPEGFVLNGTVQTVTFDYEGQDVPVMEQTAIFENERQRVELNLEKKDAKNGAVVAGAVFGLYVKSDILAHGEVIVKAGTLLGKATTGENGRAIFDLDLPFGEYYIREEKAPAGYVTSDKTIEISATYQGQNVEVAEYSSEFKNEPTAVSVKKTDLTTGAELEGATLTVLGKDGNIIDTWKSIKGQEHVIERLTVGETYTLREELAPYGYLRAEEISFTVGDTAEIQKVEMKDDVPTGTMLINKNGEFLEDVSLLDRIGGWITHLFEYVTGSLKDVTFEVFALEDIKAADGESDDYFKKDELVGTIITDDTGIAELTDLPLGKYYVKEKDTAEGYVLDGEIREVDLTYRDQNTAVITYSTDWQNNRQKAEINVLKTEKGSGHAVEGTVFALCAKEDITNTDGKVIMEADTVIEEKTTDKDGILVFAADLPIGFSYYVKETASAPGFTSEGEMKEFEFSYEHAQKEAISYEFAFENVPTVFEFTKASLTDGKEIEGAKLQVTDEDGNLIDEWISGKEPHVIKKLTVGKKYTMTEIQPANGYATAENIEFTVENTGEVQKVVMKDDVTKVEISKTDISGKELPGAKLTILDKDGKQVESWISEDKPHYIELLPIGEYTLREESAPDGYLVAEDVKFEVKDTSEIQKVVMKDELIPKEPEEVPSTRTPKTGDTRPFWLLLALVGVAACGIGSSIIIFSKKKRED